MKWQIYSIGKPSLDYARRGMAEYTKRIRRYAKLECHQQKEAGSEKNSRYLLNASEGALRIVLDERGEAVSTREFADRVRRWQNGGVKRVAFLIGGADGHSPELRKEGDETWSISSFTLQHELAQVVLLEQLYRVHTILNGEPYHRD